MTTIEAPVLGGPADGACVRATGGPLPTRVYVAGTRTNPDGTASWARVPGPVYWACYALWSDGRYRFEGRVTGEAK